MQKKKIQELDVHVSKRELYLSKIDAEDVDKSDATAKQTIHATKFIFHIPSS